MVLDPTQLQDDSTYEGHLSQEPMAQVLVTVIRSKATGRIAIHDEVGANYLYFMQGRPVGVQLSQVVYPLGQLLLELGKVDSAQFVKAQRLIGDGERLPGQVFMEIGAITEADLKETLSIQARRKAQRFATFQAVPFEFNKGLSFLTGFKSVPMEAPPLLYFSVAASLDASARQEYLEAFGGRRLRAKGSGLGAPLESFGFGRAEERFLQRLAEWHTIQELDQFGTLPREDMAALLKFMDSVGSLEVGEPAAAKPASVVGGQAPKPVMMPAPVPPGAKATKAPAVTARQTSAGAKRPDSYGPSPNSGSQSTRGRRSIDSDKKPDDSRPLPTVMVDYESLGLPPGKR